MDLDSACLVPSVPFFFLHCIFHRLPQAPSDAQKSCHLEMPCCASRALLGPDPCIPLHSIAGEPSVHTLGLVFGSWLLLGVCCVSSPDGLLSCLHVPRSGCFLGARRESLGKLPHFYLIEICHLDMAERRKSPLKQLVSCFLRLKR